jgi:tetratricopeptide (TPR) repeat protein
MTEPTGAAARQAVAEAVTLIQRGEAGAALGLLRARLGGGPEDLELRLHEALALRVLGRFEEALVALDAALAIDPYYFLALLSKGAVLERMQRPRTAAMVYRDALKIAPRPEHTPAALEAPIRRAREVVAAEGEALAGFLREQTATLRNRHAGAALGRFDECLEVLAGRKRIYHSDPVQLHVPQLPSIQFFDRSHFPWLPRLEAATGAIRAELEALLAAGMPGFAPYISYPPGAPLNQWADLNNNRQWSSLWLWRDGVRQEEAIARCPRTAALLAGLPLADQPGFAPTAVFSVLAPRTRIPPHTGSTNARLLVHLPLLLPGPAFFRVGNETRAWRMGEAWAFDDSIEHEAWNDADEPRAILIFDIWNPLLGAAERELISALMLARNAWYGAGA